MAYLARYLKDFNSDFESIKSERYYSKHCVMVLPDGTLSTGYEAMWNFFNHIYSGYLKVTRDVHSLILVLDDEEGTGRIYSQLDTRLYYKPDQCIVVPQSFVYTVGKAEEGVGTDGLQFIDLKCYYDMSLIEKAAKLRGKNVMDTMPR